MDICENCYNGFPVWCYMHHIFLGNMICVVSIFTVQLTGNVTSTRTTRHASTQETREGAGMLRGIASKAKSPGSFQL